MNHDHFHTKEPWLDALNAKSLLMRTYEKLVRDYGGVFPKDFVKTNTDEYRIEKDLNFLKMSENFSFSGMALQALKAAAPSIPGDAALTASHAPMGGANWWWFAEPLEIPTTSRKEPIVALQWNFLVRVGMSDLQRGRVTEDKIHSALMGERMAQVEIEGNLPFEVKFTAYIQHEQSGLILPSIGWVWRGEETIDGLHAHAAKDHPRGNLEGFTAADTAKAVRHVSQFFLAATTWIQQEIVEVMPQHIERHLAKRIQREHKTPARPTVQVIALRKKRLTGVTSTETSGEERHWTCQWVVSGHWRNQPYGPSRTLRKLVYVNPYVKGPDEMPLREARPKVFAVMR